MARTIKAHTRPTGQNKDIDLCLAVLDIVRPSGRPLTQREIASVIGCSPAYVFQIEKNAITKIRQNMGDITDFITDDVLNHHQEHIGQQLLGAIA